MEKNTEEMKGFTRYLKLPSLPVIPCEDRCLDPETPPEVRPLGGPNTDPHKVFGGFWKTRD